MDFIDKVTVDFLAHQQEKFELSMNEMGLLMYLLKHCPGELSVEKICKQFNQGKDAVRTALFGMEIKGLVTREQVSGNYGGSKTTYRVVFN